MIFECLCCSVPVNSIALAFSQSVILKQFTLCILYVLLFSEFLFAFITVGHADGLSPLCSQLSFFSLIVCLLYLFLYGLSFVYAMLHVLCFVSHSDQPHVAICVLTECCMRRWQNQGSCCFGVFCCIRLCCFSCALSCLLYLLTVSTSHIIVFCFLTREKAKKEFGKKRIRM